MVLLCDPGKRQTSGSFHWMKRGEFRLAKADHEAEAPCRERDLGRDLCHQIGTVAKTDLGRQSSPQASPEIELGKLLVRDACRHGGGKRDEQGQRHFCG